MDFNVFALSRDLLCLSGAFTGIAAGYILSLFRKDIKRRSRNRRIALALLFFSGTIAAFAAAIIISLGAIFKEPGVIIFAVCCVLVFALAVRFPRAAAYPLILAGGLFAVWLGFSFLRFPPVQISSVPLTAIYQIDETHHSIRLTGDRAQTTRTVRDRAQGETLQLSGTLTPLEFSAAFISFGRNCPLIGGVVRGMITKISHGSETIFSDQSMETPLLQRYYAKTSAAGINPLGINFQNTSCQVPYETIPDGMNITISYNGNADASALTATLSRLGTELK
ncbi:hypothetical protein AGMMS50293_29380 [Spirochaetia bacterium]|nr:hypothetical protein AGMMS50293_29380 [Spirochaetia bacterium]